MPAATVTVDAAQLARLLRTVEALAETTERLAETTERLAGQVNRQEATLRAKVSTPVQSLSVGEAAERMGCSVATVRRLLGRAVFTDSRGSRRMGCPVRLLGDEVDIYSCEGEEGVRRHRELMGRL